MSRVPGAPPRCLPPYPPQSGVTQGQPLFCSINQTDQMLAHLQSFSSVPEHFTLPDSTKSGVPLFYIPPGSTTPVSSPDARDPCFMPAHVGLAQLLEPRTTFSFFPSCLRHLDQNSKLYP